MARALCRTLAASAVLTGLATDAAQDMSQYRLPRGAFERPVAAALPQGNVYASGGSSGRIFMGERALEPIIARPWTAPAGLKPRVIPRNRVVFSVRDQAPAKPMVDVVITWHCENMTFLSEIDPALKDDITIILLHKVTDEDLQKPECNKYLPEVPHMVKEVRVPNSGRDVESQFKYIYNTYDALPAFTLFLQADHHWFVDQWESKTMGFKTNAEIINKMVPFALKNNPTFLAVSPYYDDQFREPILFLDRESNIDMKAQDEGNPRSLKKFTACVWDLFNQGRDTLRVLLGVNPCKEPEIVFVPGFQFLVSRQNLLARPAEVWASLSDLSLHCEATTYSIERLGIELYNSSRPMMDPDHWKFPISCPYPRKVDPTGIFFKDPFDADTMAKFWEMKWGCGDPRTPFLKEVARRRLEADRQLLVTNTSRAV